MNIVRVKQITIITCDDCRFRVYKHPHNYCGDTKSQLPEEIDEYLGIPIPENCPLPDYKKP